MRYFLINGKDNIMQKTLPVKAELILNDNGKENTSPVIYADNSENTQKASAISNRKSLSNITSYRFLPLVNMTSRYNLNLILKTVLNLAPVIIAVIYTSKCCRNRNRNQRKYHE